MHASRYVVSENRGGDMAKTAHGAEIALLNDKILVRRMAYAKCSNRERGPHVQSSREGGTGSTGDNR